VAVSFIGGGNVVPGKHHRPNTIRWYNLSQWVGFEFIKGANEMKAEEGRRLNTQL
jgi:hypothetical protein